jgi:aryl-alcohol dehydrogenase-like predicted oxidoreductase
MDGLERRPLGHTGAVVSALGYGAMELRGGMWGQSVPEEQVGRALNTALDVGINFIDTSIDYGLSEERIGRHIAHRRDEYFVATKCGCLVGWEPAIGDDKSDKPHDFGSKNIKAGVEQSLRRLRTDRIDLLQLHRPLTEQQIADESVLETLTELQRAGKVRFTGISTEPPHLAGHIAMGAFDAVQVLYSLLAREAHEYLTKAGLAGVGTVIRGSAIRGVAAGERWALSQRPELREAWEASGFAELVTEMPAQELAIRYVLSHPHVSTVIVGTVNEDHVRHNAAIASKGPLPNDVLQVVNDAVASL